MPEENVPNAEVNAAESVPTQGSEDTSGGQEDQSAGAGGFDITQDPKYQELLSHNRALNQKVVDLTKERNSSQQSPYLNPENGNYSDSLKLATADLREGLEKLFTLYPELSPDTVSRIRSNPLGFVSQDFFGKLNVQNALIDIETLMAREVGIVGGSQQAPAQPKVPAQVKPSAAPVGEDPQAQGPTAEDLWTMPMGDLEQEAYKQLRSRQ